MDLSVVIVNFNVKFFLEQCLHSVQKASQKLNVEVFVVDNDSVDGSIALLKEKFKDIHLIENEANVGFSKANNQAIRIAKGKYILLLNPDTVVQEDTFDKCFQYMEDHKDVGGLGVKMIDGKGDFLPESKRALPTPRVAFYKIFGLSALFPRSKKFGRYHLGYLDKEAINEIEVLAGAYMFMRKSVLDEVGYLDESYFMYGEDIDLSYRIIKGGYKNVYYPETMIIHYKGESTKKGSINYVLTFYNAMLIFARTHFSGANFKVFNLLINLAIYFRAAISLFKRVFYQTLLPFLDIGIFATGYYIFIHKWSQYHLGITYGYPPGFLYVIVPIYILIWLVVMYVFGAYEKPIKPKNAIKGVAIGTAVILLFYSLLPESARYSRIIILFGACWSLAVTQINRLLLFVIRINELKVNYFSQSRRIALVGSQTEEQRIRDIINQSKIDVTVVGRVALQDDHKESSIGHIDQIKQIIKVNNIEEIIFCSKDMPAQDIIRYMLDMSDLAIDFKIAPPESFSIIGSNSINTAGDLYSVNFNLITKGVNRRKKRVFDVIFSVLLIPFSPFGILFYKKPTQFIKNLYGVLINKKTWVGYEQSIPVNKLPAIKTAVLSPLDRYKGDKPDAETISKLNMLYAKDYSIQTDLSIIFKNLSKLDKDSKGR